MLNDKNIPVVDKKLPFKSNLAIQRDLQFNKRIISSKGVLLKKK